MLSVSSGKLETGRVEAPTAGSCFHFHPFQDDVGTSVVLDLQCLPSCISPSVIQSLSTGGCSEAWGNADSICEGAF